MRRIINKCNAANKTANSVNKCVMAIKCSEQMLNEQCDKCCV